MNLKIYTDGKYNHYETYKSHIRYQLRQRQEAIRFELCEREWIIPAAEKLLSR